MCICSVPLQNIFQHLAGFPDSRELFPGLVRARSWSVRPSVAITNPQPFISMIKFDNIIIVLLCTQINGTATLIITVLLNGRGKNLEAKRKNCSSIIGRSSACAEIVLHNSDFFIREPRNIVMH